MSGKKLLLISVAILAAAGAARLGWGRIGGCIVNDNRLLPFFDAEIERSRLLAEFGEPTEHALGTPRVILATRDHPIEVFDLLSNVPSQKLVELFVWREYCGTKVQSQIVAIVDPESGRAVRGPEAPLVHEYWSEHD